MYIFRLKVRRLFWWSIVFDGGMVWVWVFLCLSYGLVAMVYFYIGTMDFIWEIWIYCYCY